MEKLGLIAGNGKFPILFAMGAKSKGVKVKAVAIKGETDSSLTNFVDEIVWIEPGELGKLFITLKGFNVENAVMAGAVHKELLYKSALDKEVQNLLKEVKDQRDASLLGAVASRLKSIGITLVDSSTFLSDLLPEPGILTKVEPTQSQWQDIEFGKDIARQLAGLDIGQTIVVKDKAILAIEAIEGTDETIRRAGRFAEDGVVVKMARPKQDMRFDIPVIGPKTIDVMLESHASCLAIEAKKTLLLEKEKLLSLANTHSIPVAII